MMDHGWQNIGSYVRRPIVRGTVGNATASNAMEWMYGAEQHCQDIKQNRKKNKCSDCTLPCGAPLRHGALALVPFHARGVRCLLFKTLSAFLHTAMKMTPFWSGFQEFCSISLTWYRCFGWQLPLRSHALQPQLLRWISDHFLHSSYIRHHCCEQLPVQHVASCVHACRTKHYLWFYRIWNACRIQCFCTNRFVQFLRFTYIDLHTQDQREALRNLAHANPARDSVRPTQVWPADWRFRHHHIKQRSTHIAKLRSIVINSSPTRLVQWLYSSVAPRCVHLCCRRACLKSIAQHRLKGDSHRSLQPQPWTIASFPPHNRL